LDYSSLIQLVVLPCTCESVHYTYSVYSSMP